MTKAVAWLSYSLQLLHAPFTGCSPWQAAATGHHAARAWQRGSAPGDGVLSRENGRTPKKTAQLEGGNVPTCVAGITLFCDTGHEQLFQSLSKPPPVLYKILFYLECQAYYQSDSRTTEKQHIRKSHL